MDMWDLANAMMYVDSFLAIESTVNLETDMPEADKKYTHTHFYGGQEMGH
jgi:hypothetical protein